MIVIAARKGWNRLARHRQLVLEWPVVTARGYLPDAPPAVRTSVFETASDLPAVTVDVFTREEGIGFTNSFRRELESGAALFVVEYDGQPATVLWAKRGDRVRRWYIPLTNRDVVLYGWHTRFAYRGKGLVGVALRAAVEHYETDADRFLADVKVWNHASIRAMEKAGFCLLLSTRPLPARR